MGPLQIAIRTDRLVDLPSKLAPQEPSKHHKDQRADADDDRNRAREHLDRNCLVTARYHAITKDVSDFRDLYKGIHKARRVCE